MPSPLQGEAVAESVYRMIELVGTSSFKYQGGK
jgi:flavin-binding protein dodecin